jgi:hypothetical protein
METYSFDKDIDVICVTATAFPDGVMEAHQQLHSLIPFSEGRKYFGISWGGDAGITYMAAAEVLAEDEKNTPHTSGFIIHQGPYLAVTVHDYMKHIEKIGSTFDQLLQSPAIDEQGYCLEWYISDKDVRCMVLMKHPEKGNLHIPPVITQAKKNID